jgi:hypothetical protein
MPSFADTLGIALLSSDRDHLGFRALDLDNAAVFLPGNRVL